MVHIITIPKNVHKPVRSQLNNPVVFNCFGPMCEQLKNVNAQKTIHNAEGITKRIEQSINARRQLDLDIFESDKRILQSAEAKKKI